MNNANKTLFATLKTLVKSLNEHTPDSSYKVHELDKYKLGLYYSGFAISLLKGKIASAYILMLENTNERPAQQHSFPMDNRRPEQSSRYHDRTTPGSVFDYMYVSKVRDHLACEFKANVKDGSETVVPGSLVAASRSFQVSMAGGMLVSSAFEVNDSRAISALFSNAINAVTQDIAEKVDQFKVQSLESIRHSFPHSSYQVSVLHNTDVKGDHFLNDLIDAGGLPVRWDIKLTLSITLSQARSSNSVNNISGKTDLVSVYGYVDYIPLRHAESLGTKLPYKFGANFVVSHFDTPSHICSLEFMMLGLAMVHSYCNGNEWIGEGEKEGSLEGLQKPIGRRGCKGVHVLNRKYNPLKPKKRQYFNSKELPSMGAKKFVQTLVNPQMVISVDVPSASEVSWNMGVFEYICKNNNTRLLEQLESFVGYKRPESVSDRDRSKEWGSMFDEKCAPTYADGGFAVMPDGRKMDIRQIADYVWVAGTQPDESLYAHTDDTFRKAISPDRFPSDVQESIYRQFDAQFTHSHTRLIFNREFLEHWTHVVQQAGVDTRTDAVKRASGRYNAM